MRDGLAIRRAPAIDKPARDFFEHSSGLRVNTDTVIFESLQQQYPDGHITIVPEFSCNLLAYAAAGHALAIEDPKVNATKSGSLKWLFYAPPLRRIDGDEGALGEEVLFGRFKYAWGNDEFVLYVSDGRDGGEAYPKVRNQYLISASKDREPVERLVLAAGGYLSTLHNEIWVFDRGYWQKDANLYQSMMKASWDDIILDSDMKRELQDDVNRFFNGRATYEKLRVPWKRGIIYYGPPGNGKTITIKATMHTLYKREQSVPTLYVKTLAGFLPPEFALGSIFEKARQQAPCFLVFEDLDSIVRDDVRSFFLNEVDGLSNNDGICMVGSTNHLDRLDPGIVKRPSRFDRKYLFPNPGPKEREQYARYWRGKLEGNDEGVEFPERMCPAIAKITDKFSFAYMQEAFVAALLRIASQHDKDADALVDSCLGEYFVEHGGGGRRGSDDDLDKFILWRELKKQIKTLREDLGSDDDDD